MMEQRLVDDGTRLRPRRRARGRWRLAIGYGLSNPKMTAALFGALALASCASLPPESGSTHRLSAKAIASVRLDPAAAAAALNAYRAGKGLGPVRLDPARRRWPSGRPPP